MAKVLSAISRDSPASPVSASVNDTFSFAGTPTLSGGGGVQRYDFRWEVNPGSGYVPISGSTGLTTANTNPLVNTNSQTQNAITVTCNQVGSYTIRMAGAPTSGGAYTVFSPTQTVQVALAAITGSLSATESGSDTASLSGSVAVQGSMSAQESGSDSFTGSGSVESPAVTGSLLAQESGADSFSGAASVDVAGSLLAGETGTDGFVGSGEVAVGGALAATESGSDTFSGSASVESQGGVSGSISTQESGADEFAGSASVLVGGSLSAVESGSDTASLSGLVLIQGGMGAQEDGGDLFLSSSIAAPRRTAAAAMSARPRQMNHTRPSGAAMSRPANISRGTR